MRGGSLSFIFPMPLSEGKAEQAALLKMKHEVGECGELVLSFLLSCDFFLFFFRFFF